MKKGKQDIHFRKKKKMGGKMENHLKLALTPKEKMGKGK